MLGTFQLFDTFAVVVRQLRGHELDDRRRTKEQGLSEETRDRVRVHRDLVGLAVAAWVRPPDHIAREKVVQEVFTLSARNTAQLKAEI